MPKRIGFLYEKMLDKAFIESAIVKCSKGKTKRGEVQRVLANKKKYIDIMYRIIETESYKPSKPKLKQKYDYCSKKTRAIEVVPFFPDGIMHQMIVEAMRPVFMRGMYAWSCASIPGRGTMRAARYVKKVIRQDKKNTKYVFKMDIKKFYPSIDRERLMRVLEHKTKDNKMLFLVRSIIESCAQGLAIGFYICQWLANIYLEELDHFIMRLDGVERMVRNMDDIVIFGPNKRKLHKVQKAIKEFLDVNMGLTMKPDWQIWPLKSRMLDFVGYRFARTHTILRKSNFLRFTRQCRRIAKRQEKGKRIHYKQAAGVLSRAAQLKHCDGHFALKKYMYPIGVHNMKEVVSNESKSRFPALGGVHGRARA